MGASMCIETLRTQSDTHRGVEIMIWNNGLRLWEKEEFVNISAAIQHLEAVRKVRTPLDSGASTDLAQSTRVREAELPLCESQKERASVSSRRGLQHVVFHRSREAAQNEERHHGLIPSGSAAVLLKRDPRGARGWACVEWQGQNVYVRQGNLQNVTPLPTAQVRHISCSRSTMV